MNLNLLRKKRVLFLGFLTLLGSALFIDCALFLRSVYRYRVLAITPKTLPPEDKKKEVIIVLTGDGFRIPRSLELLEERKKALLLISGTAKGITRKDLMNAQRDPSLPVSAVWDRILLESSSSSTVENAQNSFAIVNKEGFERIILVTSDYHMERSRQIFTHFFSPSSLIEYPTVSGSSGRVFLWKVFIEYTKLFSYRFWCLSHYFI
jgi:uncharacterized SAM-binding protein YcdF (DUF218 family)